MTLFLTPHDKDDPERLNLTVKYMAATWADLILLGLNNGEKPEILVDRSGSMQSHAVKPFSRMDVSRTLIHLVAQILSKRNAGFDLNQIPVKSWGSGVYDEHPMMTDMGEIITTKTTLAHFYKNTNLPMIPCTDGTNHDLWFNESDFPLVITDDYYNPVPEFVENMKRFDWCNGANIIVVDNYGRKFTMLKTDQEVIDLAQVNRLNGGIVPSDYSQEDFDELSNSRGYGGAYERMRSIIDGQ